MKLVLIVLNLEQLMKIIMIYYLKIIIKLIIQIIVTKLVMDIIL